MLLKAVDVVAQRVACSCLTVLPNIMPSCQAEGASWVQVIGVHNPGTPESALIDMRLLSECNELVVTVGSSYGSVSAGIGGIAPVQMLHGLHKNVQVQHTILR